MPSTKLSRIAGSGGFTPASANPYVAGGNATAGALRPKNGRSYGTVAGGAALTTIMDITEKAVFSNMFLTQDGNGIAWTDRIQITVNGTVIHNVTSSLSAGTGAIIVLFGQAFYAALSTSVSVTAEDGGAVFYGVPMVVDSIKVEVATNAGGSTVSLRADLEMIQ